MKHILSNLFFMLLLNVIYSQQYKYDVWPVEDNTKEVEASFGEYTPSTILHETIDIYGAGESVVPARKWAKFKPLIAIHFYFREQLNQSLIHERCLCCPTGQF
jgi:hypothetical protein